MSIQHTKKETAIQIPYFVRYYAWIKLFEQTSYRSVLSVNTKLTLNIT